MKGRQRGRNGGKPRMHHQGGGGGGRNQNFDNNAGRMRGNAQQLLDKYLALGRDASSQGDRVLSENYFQHADHYYRVVNARFEGQQNQNPNQQHRRFNGSQQGGYDGQDGNDGQDGQGNYNDFNRSDIPPGPSQNLIPGGQPIMDQPQVQPQQQPQQNFDNGYQPQQHQPASREPEGDIGLPPTLFGDQPQRDDAPQGNGESQGNQGGNEGRGFRPRHSGRRRFGGNRNQQAAEPTGEPT
jgi:hypothetical protein